MREKKLWSGEVVTFRAALFFLLFWRRTFTSRVSLYYVKRTGQAKPGGRGNRTGTGTAARKDCSRGAVRCGACGPSVTRHGAIQGGIHARVVAQGVQAVEGPEALARVQCACASGRRQGGQGGAGLELGGGREAEGRGHGISGCRNGELQNPVSGLQLREIPTKKLPKTEHLHLDLGARFM